MSIPILFPFQEAACEHVMAAARHNKVIVLQSPTGSGKSTMGAHLTHRATLKGKRVLFIVHRRRLVDQFSDRLIDFKVNHGICMRGHRLERNALVQVASRDTLLAKDYELPPADLVIVDEGRHAAAPEFRRLLAPYKDKHIILLDATPVMSDGGGLGPWAQFMVQAAKTSDLVRDGYLVPVKCFAPDRKHGRAGKMRRGIAGDLVSSWQQHAENQPTVLFCSRVEHSKSAVKAFNAAGIPAAHVDASTPDDERDRIFDGLRTGAVKVVSNVGIIKEGVDIPCLGCCQIYMDMRGRVAFIQAVGRIMRAWAGKTHGILIDHAGAVFQFGFPDEDTHWTLNGNVDAEFSERPDPKKALYCEKCSLLYHDQRQCPQCGSFPATPPRSMFGPPPVDATNEALVEADRQAERGDFSYAAKVSHWWHCLAAAHKRGGTYGQAARIYQRRFPNEWPDRSFPHVPDRSGWKQKVPPIGRTKQE